RVAATCAPPSADDVPCRCGAGDGPPRAASRTTSSCASGRQPAGEGGRPGGSGGRRVVVPAPTLPPLRPQPAAGAQSGRAPPSATGGTPPTTERSQSCLYRAGRLGQEVPVSGRCPGRPGAGPGGDWTAVAMLSGSERFSWDRPGGPAPVGRPGP